LFGENIPAWKHEETPKKLQAWKLFEALRNGHHLKRSQELVYKPWAYGRSANTGGAFSTFPGWWPDFLSSEQRVALESSLEYKAITGNNTKVLTCKTLPAAFRKTYFFRLLRDVIAPKNFVWVLMYIAHILTNPDERVPCAPCITSDHGCGKNAWTDSLRELLGVKHVRIFQTMQQILGRFNVRLTGSLVSVFNEMRCRGKNTQERADLVKALLSDPWIQVEEKYKPARDERNLSRWICLSNNEGIVRVEGGNRRWVMLKATNKHRNDRAFFGALYRELRSAATLLAIMNVLTRLKEPSVCVYSVPHTVFEREEKITQAHPIWKFLVRLCENWQAKCTDFDNAMKPLLGFDPIEEFHGEYELQVAEKVLYIKPRTLAKWFGLWYEHEFLLTKKSRCENDTYHVTDFFKKIGLKTTRPRGLSDIPGGRPEVYRIEQSTQAMLAKHLHIDLTDIQRTKVV
jgi:hypothetical protein